jgi:hypothetical protein
VNAIIGAIIIGAATTIAWIYWREIRNGIMDDIDIETAVAALADSQEINGWWMIYWTGQPESPTFHAIGGMPHHADAGAAKAIRIISSMGTGILQQGGAVRQGPTE